MKDEDKNQFAAMFTGICEIYGREASKPLMKIYFDSLRKYDVGTVSTAFSKHVQNADQGTFFPKPAEIIKMIEGTANDAANNAWSKLDDAIRTVGTYQSVIFDDKLIHAIVCEIGGWIALGEKKEDEWPFIAKDFKERYRALKIHDNVRYTGKLIGILERDNTMRGFPAPAPLLIGDQFKAREVLVNAKSNVMQIHAYQEKIDELTTLAFGDK